MKRSGDVTERFVDEHEVLVHPLGINRSLEHEQILRSDQTMLHSGLEMKPVPRRERRHGKRLTGGAPPQDEPRALLHLQAFILLFMRFKSEVSTLTDYEILFDPRMRMEHDDHTSPRRLYSLFATPFDALEKFSKQGGRSKGRIAEVLTPEQAGLSAIAIERLPGIDARLGAEIARQAGKLRITR